MNELKEVADILQSALTLRLDSSFFDLKREDQLAVVKKSYRGLSKILHPDKGGSEEEFKKLVLSKDFLLSRIKENRLTIQEKIDDIILESNTELNELSEEKLTTEIDQLTRAGKIISKEKKKINLISGDYDISINSSFLSFVNGYWLKLYDSRIYLETKHVAKMPENCEIEVIENRIQIKIFSEITQHDVCHNTINTETGIKLKADSAIRFGDSFVVDINDFLSINFIFSPVIVV